ncbi:MAG: hypothetical protein M1827_002816 [Pycnora praestabilis]|nr:MAG: hypothetical protein M1827_002816 [Pycnora praestabilis]
MPSFYGGRGPPTRMPLTPPEYASGYSVNSCGMPISTLYRSARSEKESYLMAKPNAQYPFDGRWPPIGWNQQSQKQPPFSGVPQGFALPGQMYGPIAAPILPPIRNGENLSQYRRPQEQVARPAEKNKEKAVGGVATILDYEMDQMTDFVSEMAQGMYELYISRICLADIDIIRSVQSGSPASTAFRKYVSQILTSTRLPSSTILLGLYYLATRMTKLSASGQYHAMDVYRMLTVSLILGSKFLDDNTFQNRSWSEVSAIDVRELNKLEIDWLLSIDWNLHVEPYEHLGFMSWKEHWDQWKEKALARASDVPKLTPLPPLDTSVQRQRSINPDYSPTPTISTQYGSSTQSEAGSEYQQSHRQGYTSYNPWTYHPSSAQRSPPSAPETSPNTPEYFGLPSTWSFNAVPPTYSTRSIPGPMNAAHVSTQPPSYYHTPYGQQYSSNIWNGHGHGSACGCTYCIRPQDAYFMNSGYGAQSVAG